jgi:hypothetical protein
MDFAPNDPPCFFNFHIAKQERKSIFISENRNRNAQNAGGTPCFFPFSHRKTGTKTHFYIGKQEQKWIFTSENRSRNPKRTGGGAKLTPIGVDMTSPTERARAFLSADAGADRATYMKSATEVLRDLSKYQSQCHEKLNELREREQELLSKAPPTFEERLAKAQKQGFRWNNSNIFPAKWSTAEKKLAKWESAYEEGRSTTDFDSLTHSSLSSESKAYISGVCDALEATLGLPPGSTYLRTRYKALLKAYRDTYT